MLRTVAGFGRPNNHREVNQRMAKTDARSPRTERGTIALQDASQDIWDKKYRLKSKDGTPVDASVDGTWQRVARALADVEDKASREHWYGRFLWALRNGAIPAGRIISNAGALGHKPATSTINCTVSGTIQDSMDNILEKVHEAGLTLKAGCGIGYEFSTLRPRGAYVSGAGAYTSGPLSFMDIYDKMCFTVSSAGGRRGAQMGTFDVSHPDVREFIRAKREDGRLRQFNLSLLITDQFMQAVEQDADWPLVFPVHVKERDEIDLDDPNAVVWREWPIQDDYVQRADGLVACKVYGQVRARHLWDMIMVSTYDYAEPGFILIDRVNELNTTGGARRSAPPTPAASNHCRRMARACSVRSTSPASSSSHLATRRASTGTVSAKWCGCLPGCSTTWWKSTACRWNSNARKSLASAGMAWASSAWARP